MAVAGSAAGSAAKLVPSLTCRALQALYPGGVQANCLARADDPLNNCFGPARPHSQRSAGRWRDVARAQCYLAAAAGVGLIWILGLRWVEGSVDAESLPANLPIVMRGRIEFISYAQSAGATLGQDLL